MEKTISNTGYFFVALLILTFFGFYITYFGTFPEFKNTTSIQHFHAIIFLSWFALLITQPFLIRYKKFALHRRLGKVSYFLMPLVLLSIYLACRSQFENGVVQNMPLEVNRALVFMPMQAMFLFGFFYLLGILNTRNTSSHMRYIVASSLVLMGPALGRIFILWLGMDPHDGIWYGGLLPTDIALFALLIWDIVKQKRSYAYAVALAVSATCHVAWYMNFGEMQIWQSIAAVIF